MIASPAGGGGSPRIVLLTTPSVMSNAATRHFIRAMGSRIALVGTSNPARRSAGGITGQLRKQLARSGPRILPYLALGFGIPHRLFGPATLDIDDVNGPVAREAIAAVRPDLIVTLHFDQILAADTIALARLGGINLHPSLLPRHRGPVPAFWGLLEGATGVSVHRLVTRIDAGEVLAQREVTLPPGISALDASRRLHLAGVPLLVEVVARFAAGPVPHVTPPAPLPYCPFPDAATLRAAARRGVRLVRVRDITLLQPGRVPD